MARDLTVQARVNWGRWIVDCPSCNGAEHRAKNARDYRKNGGYWRGEVECRECGYKQRVTEPDAASRAEIERLLAVRPVRNRNWRPGESTARLRAENSHHVDELLATDDQLVRADVLVRI